MAAGGLAAVLGEAQRIGLIGPGPLSGAVDHAERFAELLAPTARTVVDVGSGGGLPGLVVATERADMRLTLVDRRGRACDFLRRAVRALGLEERVVVVHAELDRLGHDPRWRGAFDAATARGVGPPEMVAELVLPLVRAGGQLVVSVREAGEGWPDEGLAVLGARLAERRDGFVVVAAGSCPPQFPRARRIPPVFALGVSRETREQP